MDSRAWCLLCYSERFSVNVFGVDAVFACVCVCVCVARELMWSRTHCICFVMRSVLMFGFDATFISVWLHAN